MTIGATAAAAATGTPAADIATVLATNTTLAAANGHLPVARSADGLTLTLRRVNAVTGCPAVVVGAGGTANNYSGVNTGATHIVIRGDPGDASQRACIVRAPPSANPFAYYPTSGTLLVRLTALSVEAGTYSPTRFSGGAWFDNAEIRGSQVPTDQRAGSASLIATASQMWLTNGKWWQYGAAPSYFSYQTLMLAWNRALGGTSPRRSSPTAPDCRPRSLARRG